MGGMNEGDYVVAINEEDVKWSPHDEVVTLIKSSGNHLKLKLVTPMDKSHSKENKKSSVHNRSDHRLCNVSITSQPQSHHLGGSSSPTSTGSSGCSSGVNIAPFSSSGISSRESSNSSESPTSSITSGSTRSTKTKENDSKMNNNVRKDNHFKEYNNHNIHNNRAQTTAEENGNWNVFKKTSTGSVPKQYSKDATSKRTTNTNREPSKLSSARNDKNSRR